MNRADKLPGDLVRGVPGWTYALKGEACRSSSVTCFLKKDDVALVMETVLVRSMYGEELEWARILTQDGGHGFLLSTNLMTVSEP